jgi:hypothetical protein
MIRKPLLAAALVAMPMALLAGLSAGAAQAAAPVTFKGSISCSLTGTAIFTPPLTLANKTVPTKVTFTGKNDHCRGIHGTKLTQGHETLKASKEKFSYTIPANPNGACAALASGTLPPITGAVVTWIGTSPITPTKLNLSSGTVNPNTGVFEYLNGVSTGSFAGSARVALQATQISEPGGVVVPYSAANALAACQGKGISDLTLSQPNPEPPPFATNDNLEIGQAF